MKYVVILLSLFLLYTAPIYADGWQGDSLRELTDTEKENEPADGEVLLYNSTNFLWEYEPLSIDDIEDFSITLPADGDFLLYEDTTGKWENTAITIVTEAFKTISVSGQSDVVADTGADTLTLVEAGILAITTNASTDTITLTATEVDGSTTNELQDLWDTISSQSGSTTADSNTDTLTINGAGISSIAIVGDTLTITTPTQTLDVVTTAGDTTTNAISTGNQTITGNNPAQYWNVTGGDSIHIFSGAEGYLAFTNITAGLYWLTLNRLGDAVFGGNVEAQSLHINGVGSFDGNLTTSGNLNVAGTGIINGNTSLGGNLTIGTGNNLTIGITQWNTADDIDGEQVADDTIDEDSIDFGTGTDQVSAVDVPILDTKRHYTGTDVEAALSEIGDLVSAVAFDLFWDNAASDIGGYLTMSPTATGDPETSVTVAGLGSGDAQAVEEFAATAAESPDVLAQGIYEVHFHAERTAGNRSVILFGRLYKREDDNDEILLATSEDTNDITAKVAVDFHFTFLTEVNILSTDRLVLKILTDIGSSGSNVAVTIYMEGDLASRLTVETTLTALDNRYVLVAGDTMTGDLTISTANAALRLEGPSGKNYHLYREPSNLCVLADTDTGWQAFRVEGNDALFLVPHSGSVSIRGGLGFDTSKELYVGGDIEATGTLTIAGATQLDSTLGVTGVTTLDSNLIMSGSSANIALGSNYLSGDGDDEGVFIDSSGNVFIGTTASMLAPLNITGDTASIEDRHEGIWMRSKTGGYIVQLNVRGPRLEIGGGGNLDTTPAMSVNYLTSNVGIGVTDPDTKLEVVGVTTTAGAIITDSNTLTFDESAADPNDADVVLSATDGVLTIGAVNGVANNDITIDFDISGGFNEVSSSSSTPMLMSDDKYIGFSRNQSARIKFGTTGNNSMQFSVKVGDATTGSGYLSLMEVGDEDGGNRSPLATSADPVLRVYSSDETAPLDYIETFHDQVNGVIQVADGSNSPLEIIDDARTILNTTASRLRIDFQDNDAGTMVLICDVATNENVIHLDDGGGNQLILSNTNNLAQNFDHAVQTNPTYFIQSDLNPTTSNNQWGSLHHDQEDFVITTGANIGTGTAPTTDNNDIIFSPQGTEKFRVQGLGGVVYNPSSAQAITAVGDAVLANAAMVVLNPDADYTLTSTPTIADGITGQILYITSGNGEANTVSVQDQGTLGGSNLQLGDTSRVVGALDVLVLLFDGTDWIEVSFQAN